MEYKNDYKGVPLSSLKGKQKFQYIWDYYKFVIIGVVIVLGLIINGVHSHFAKKNEVVSLGLVNVLINEQDLAELEAAYLEEKGLDPSKNTVEFFSDLTYTEPQSEADTEPANVSAAGDTSADTEAETEASFDLSKMDIDGSPYGYLKEVKLMAALSAKQLDVVIMDEVAYKAFLGDDNLIDPICLNDTAFAKEIGLTGTAYAGVVGNSNRPEEAKELLEYLARK